jgi:hypothetical protein
MYSIRYIVVIINFCNVLIVVCVKAVSRCISASGFICIKPGFPGFIYIKPGFI